MPSEADYNAQFEPGGPSSGGPPSGSTWPQAGIVIEPLSTIDQDLLSDMIDVHSDSSS
jgi:hypothetical protein